MATLQANGITLDYAETGSAADPAFVLIRGLGTQRIQWPAPLLDGLAASGFRVVTFDNRDVGHSTKFPPPGGGEAPRPAYTLADMAADVVGLLDALGIERAHVAGMSLGGMIAQHLAISHAARLRSMTSIMSSSGNPELPPGTPEAMAVLMSAPPDPTDRDSVLAHAVRTQKIIGSPGYPTDEAILYANAARAFDRCYYPAGVAHQMFAVIADGSRVDRLRRVTVPTLVVHGEDDPLIPIAAGRDTAANIPGASFVAVPGMGHDIPLGLVATLVDLLAGHALEADRAAA